MVLALLVFIHHAGALFDPTLNSFNAGAVGVFLFFVVSGFVIAEALDRFYRHRLLQFLVARALRIFPLFLVCLLLAAGGMAVLGIDRIGEPLAPVLAMVSLQRLLTAATILGSFADGGALAPLPPAWSLRVEFAFYLLACAAAAWLAACRPRPGLALLVGSTALLTSFIAGISLTLVLPGQFYEGVTLLVMMPFFVIGTSLYALSSRGLSATAGLSLGLAVVLAALWLCSTDGYTFSSVQLKRIRIGNLVAVGALLTAFAALLRLEGGPRWRRLDRALGDLTYPVYLCHPLVLAFALHGRSQGDALSWVAALSATFLLALLLHRGVESPLQTVRDRLRGQPLVNG